MVTVDDGRSMRCFWKVFVDVWAKTHSVDNEVKN